MADIFIPRPQWCEDDVLWAAALKDANAQNELDTPGTDLGITAGAWQNMTRTERTIFAAVTIAKQLGCVKSLSLGEQIAAALKFWVSAFAMGAGAETGTSGIGSLLGESSDIQSYIGSPINTGITETNDTINTLLATGESVLNETGNVITQLLRGLIGNGTGTSASLAGRVISGIGETSNAGINAVSNIASILLGKLETNADNQTTLLGKLAKFVLGNLNELLITGGDVTKILEAKAIDAITNVVRHNAQTTTDELGKVGDAIVPLIKDAADHNAAVSTKISEALQRQIDQSEQNAKDAQNNLHDAINAITGESESALATTRDVLQQTGAGQIDATLQGAKEVGGAVQESVGGLTQKLSDFFSSFDDGSTEKTRAAVKDAIAAAVDFGGCPPNFRDVLTSFIDEMLGKVSLMGGAAQIMSIPTLINGVIQPVSLVLSNCIAQAAARLAPTTLPNESSVQDQMRRGIIGQPEAIESLLSQGYSVDRAANILAQRFQIPEIGLVQTWWLRGLIDTERAVVTLQHLGYTNDDIEPLLQMSFFIPPVQDLITMAVREVFSPAIAEKFGQFEDFPSEFADFARQQGVSEEWAKNYWAAHWGLPSPAQGFEMFQRRVPGTNDKIITGDELQTLLRALDIMPFWRDKLTNIAYQPITRVDIRRVHKLGLISNDELIRRYEDIGYSPPDAELLAQFTIELNKQGGSQNTSEIKGVTLSMILRLFEQGTFSELQAVTALKEAGAASLAIPILIEDVKIRQEIDERNAKTDLLIQQARAGVITFAQAYDRLGQLGLTSIELAKAQTKLEAIRAQQTRLPTEAQAEKMLKKGIINEAQYLDVLERLGFSPQWSQRYLALAQG